MASLDCRFISSVHSIFIKRLLEAAHIHVKYEEDGTIIEQHLSLAHTLRVARAGYSAFTTLGLEDKIKELVGNCPTCKDEDDEECEPPGIFKVTLTAQPRDSPLHNAPQLLQLSRDIRGPWKISFTGIGTGIYPSHLQACSCHCLLSHRKKSQTEEFLQLANDLQVTVFRCDCPGIIQEKGTEFNLSLLWQLTGNHRQLLKQRLVLIRPQYIF